MKHWPLLALFLAACAIYGRTVGHGFVFDDADYVENNVLLADGWTLESARAAFTTYHSANWHPLTWLSHMLDVELFGLDPAGHHAVNTLLHGLNAVLLFLALVALTGARIPSLVVAGLFVVHPLRVESVAWISERKDLLSGAFFFATLLAYARYVERSTPVRYLVVLLSYTAAALAKPTVVTLWCVLLCLDAWPLRRVTRARAWRLILEKLPLIAISAGLVLLTLRSQGEFGAVGDEASFPLDVRALNALAAYGFYLGKTVWPVGLACFYPHAAIVEPDPVAALRWPALWGAAGVAGGLFAGALVARRQAAVLVGWLVFVGMLVPMLGLVQVGRQAWADRYAYLPLIGVYVALVWPLAHWVARNEKWKKAAGVTAVLVCLAFAARSFQLAGTWRDGEALFLHALEVTEENFIAHNNLGGIYLGRDELQLAEEHLEAALALQPNDVQVNHNLSIVREREGDIAGAIRHEQRTLQGAPDDPLTYVRIGQLRARTGDVPAAEAAYRKVLELDPGELDALYNLGVLAARRGDLEAAEARYVELLGEDPDFVDALVNLGDLYTRGGRPREALVPLRRATQVRPEEPLTHLNLAVALQATGDAAGALESYRRTLSVDPDRIQAANGLAWILATHSEDALRDGATARTIATEWVERTGRENAILLQTLAAACAETGDFDAAEEWQRRAITLLAERPRALSTAETRLETYLERRPLRLP